MRPITDEFGRVLGVRCHDGHFLGLNVIDAVIRLRFRREDGTAVEIELDGVRFFALDGFREGNIVDSVYAWPIAQAPADQRKKASEVFSCDENLLRADNELGADLLFFLEPSYGGAIYAMVRDMRVTDDERTWPD